MNANFKYEVHPCNLDEPAPKNLEVSFNDKSYMFRFYINEYGRYVALCNGSDKFFGEGANWWIATNDCMTKILNG